MSSQGHLREGSYADDKDDGLATLLPYVAPPVLRRLADPLPLADAECERRTGAALFADVSGFTEITERLTHHEQAAAERVAHLLNAYFDAVVGAIDEYAGDVVTFAGDALIAVWTSQNEPEAACARDATACALTVQRRVGGTSPVDGVPVSLRVGVGAGEVVFYDLAGGSARRFFLAGGSAVEQAGVAQRAARPGEVAITRETRSMLGCRAMVVDLPGGLFRLVGMNHSAPSPGEPALVDAACSVDRLAAYVPTAVSARAQFASGGWLAELRRVSVVFARLLGFDHAAVGAAEGLRHTVAVAAAAVERFGGTTLDARIDEKGTLLVATFGLPSLAHEDDAARALEAASAIHQEIAAEGLAAGVGVATGVVFCGPIEARERRFYSVMGAAANLAARLMEAASNDVLCDTETHLAASVGHVFERVPSLLVRGRRDPVQAYRVRRGRTGARERARAVRRIFGRAREQQLLREHLDDVCSGSCRVMVIAGEPGMGKSRLVAELVAEAERRTVTPLIGQAEAVESATPYHAWRPIFAALLGVSNRASPHDLAREIFQRLEARPDLTRLAPLLNTVVPLGLPETEETAEMTGQLRSDNLEALLVELLQQAGGSPARPKPLLVVLEDAHWLDASSWSLARAVGTSTLPLLLVLALRPVEDPPKEYEDLVGLERATRLRLEELAPDESLALVRDRLDIGALAATVETLILDRAAGNPLYLEELAYALRDAGVLVRRGETYVVSDEVPEAAITVIPTTVEGLIASRIDRLTPADQLALKVASVIGPRFEATVLEAIYPVEGERLQLREILARLAHADMVRPPGREPDGGAYAFKHVVTQQVAYGSLLFAQRRMVHRAVAEWYERTLSDDFAPLYPLLAHHWRAAEDHVKTRQYLELAGEQALATGAYRSAVRFLAELIERTDPGAAGGDDHGRRARWERQLGEAHLGRGDPDRGRKHLLTALGLLESPEPAGAAGLVAALAGQIIRQAAHMAVPRGPNSRRLPDGGRRLEGARAYSRLVETYWFANETLPLVHAALRAVNLAERAGPSPELARAYAIMCLASGSVPLRRLADYYGNRAETTARQTDQRLTLAYVVFIRSVYEIGIGRWERVREACTIASELFGELGDRRLRGDSETVLAMTDLYRGKFDAAENRFRSVLAAGRRDENVQHEAWGLIGVAEVLLRLGRPGEATSALEAALNALERSPNDADALRAHGLLAVTALAAGDQERARREAAQTEELLAGLRAPTSHYLLEGYAAPAEVYLRLGARPATESDSAAAALERRTRVACQRLRAFARVFPIGEPRARLCTGALHAARGRTAPARREFTRSLRLAERIGMPY
jgi:class 3 adenylate cyclase/tetratricopeptide (TPR) repeat protein